MEIIDISRDMLHCDIYPGDPAPSAEIFHSISGGDDCNLAIIHAGLHTGTHVDAPLHFIENGKSIDRLPLSLFIGECEIIEVPPGPITGDYVERYFPRTRERILVKSRGKAYFHETGACELAMYDTKLIGTDALSVGTSGAQTAVHKAFLRENIALLEGLNLENVKPGEYFLMAQPIKTGGTEASFCRAVLVTDHIFWSARG